MSPRYRHTPQCERPGAKTLLCPCLPCMEIRLVALDRIGGRDMRAPGAAVIRALLENA